MRNNVGFKVDAGFQKRDEDGGVGPEHDRCARSLWMCTPGQEGLATEAEARHWIITHAPCFERKNAVWTKYKTAIAMGSAFFETLNTKKKRF